MNDSSARNRKLIWLLVGLLFILHHDFWLWGNPSLVFGFLPVGLAYHLAYSVAAGCTWFAMVKFAWPSHVEDFANERENQSTTPNQKP